MKKLFIFASLLLVFSCSNDYEVPQTTEDPELVKYLDAAIAITYETHLWMNEENECEELECCWCYVPKYLRDKYERGDKLTVKEKELIVAGIESSPSFLDTLGEGDEFYYLWCYKEYGPSFFEIWEDPDV